MTEPTGYEKSRSDLLNESVKASLIVNGGGAVAILAFVQSIWNTSNALRDASLTALFIMTIALFLTLLVPIFRFHHSKRAAGQRKMPTVFSRAYIFCLYASPILFIIATIYLTIVAWGIE